MVFMFKKFHMYYNKYTWPKKKLVYLLCIRESNGRNHILVSRLHVSKQKKVALTETLSGKSFFPEPQNDPGVISKCRGYKESLNEVVIGWVEIDFVLKVDPMKQYKCLAVRREAS